MRLWGVQICYHFRYLGIQSGHVSRATCANQSLQSRQTFPFMIVRHHKACRGFTSGGGGGSIEPPKTGGGGFWKRAQLTGTINQSL